MQKCENCQNWVAATQHVTRGNVAVDCYRCACGYAWEDYDVPPSSYLMTPAQAVAKIAERNAKVAAWYRKQAAK